MDDLQKIWNGGKGNLPEDKLLAYLEGKLSPEEQHEVELWLSEEGMESDAGEGLKEIPPDEVIKMAGKLNQRLTTEVLKRKGRRNRPVGVNAWSWVAIAVVLLVCLLAYFVLYVLAR